MNKIFVRSALALTGLCFLSFWLYNSQKNKSQRDQGIQSYVDRNLNTAAPAFSKEHRSIQRTTSIKERVDTYDTSLLKLGALLSLDNPEKAYSKLLEQKLAMTEAEFNKYQQEILFVWAEEDPETVTQLLSSITSPDTRAGVIRAITNGWANIDVQKGFDVLDSALMDEVPAKVYNQCYAILMDKFAKQDVLAAAKILEEFDDQEFQKSLIYPIVTHYAQLDYPQALEWAANLESDFLRNLAMLNLLDLCDEADQSNLITTIEKHQSKFSPYLLKTVSTKLNTRNSL